jgi:uncharacterized protein
MSLESKNFVPAAVIILALALFGGLWLHGYEMAGRDKLGLTVTGSVKQTVTADLAKWSASFTRRANLDNLKTVLASSAKDKTDLTNFVTGLGVDAQGITFLPVQTNAIYEQLPGYGYTQNIIGYNVVQEVHVESADIDKVEKLGAETSKIIDLGIIPDYQRTEYFYTKLSELRPQLYSEATTDAKTRAEAIASGTGVKVGDLMSAKTGIIQITAPNSTDVSDYGVYDLSTRQKDVTATVSVTFRLK